MTVPVAMRVAANAGTYAARWMWANPALAVGVIAAPAVYDWLRDHGYIQNSNGTFGKIDPSVCTTAPCYGFTLSATFSTGPYSVTTSTRAATCAAYLAYMNGLPNPPYSQYNVNLGMSGNSCYYAVYNRSNNSFVGYYSNLTPTQVSVAPQPVQTVPTTLSEFEAALGSEAVPPSVLPHIPAHWPIEQPLINPSSDPTPVPQPIRVPLGDPVKVPNSDPLTWKQPVLDIVPAPSPSSPLQVDLQPKDIVTVSPTQPEPIREPETVEEPTPGEEQSESPDFCAKNPTVLACQEVDLDTPDGEIPTRTENLTYEAVNAWGNGSCPNDTMMTTVTGKTFKVYEWGSKCVYIIDYVKPVIITAALITALFILMPGGRPE